MGNDYFLGTERLQREVRMVVAPLYTPLNDTITAHSVLRDTNVVNNIFQPVIVWHTFRRRAWVSEISALSQNDPRTAPPKYRRFRVGQPSSREHRAATWASPFAPD